jgi:hypothetical protein
LAQELSHPYTLAYALFFTGVLPQLRGDHEAALAVAETLVELSREQTFPLWVAGGQIHYGAALAAQQDPAGITQILEGLAVWRATGAELWQLTFLLRAPALGNILDGEQDQLQLINPTRVEQHYPMAEGFKIVLDLEALEEVVFRQDFGEQTAQLRDVPLAVAELVDQPALSRSAVNLESFEKCAIGGLHAEVVVQDEERLRHCIQNDLGQVLRRAPAQGSRVSTSWVYTSSANGNHRSSSAWARTPPSSPIRSPQLADAGLPESYLRQACHNRAAQRREHLSNLWSSIQSAHGYGPLVEATRERPRRDRAPDV